MFLPVGKSDVALRRDVCLWHVADYICHHEVHYIVILYKVLCHCEERSDIIKR